MDDVWLQELRFMVCIGVYCWMCDLRDNLSERPHHPHWNFREKRHPVPTSEYSSQPTISWEQIWSICCDQATISSTCRCQKQGHETHWNINTHGSWHFACTLCQLFDPPKNYILYTYIIYQINIHNNHCHDTSERPAPSTICRPSGLLGAPTHLRPAAPENQNQRQLRVTFLGSKCFLKLLILSP